MVDYNLGKSESGKYQQLASKVPAFVKSLTMYGFGDCFRFERDNKDGSTFGSDWGLQNLGCFKEIGPYERLKDMPLSDLKRLASRISKTLARSSKAPIILEELVALQDSQKQGVASGRIKFPEISEKELAAAELW